MTSALTNQEPSFRFSKTPRVLLGFFARHRSAQWFCGNSRHDSPRKLFPIANFQLIFPSSMNSPGIFLIRWFNGLSSCKMRNERKNPTATFVLAGKEEPNVISLIFRSELVNYFYYFSFLSHKLLFIFSSGRSECFGAWIIQRNNELSVSSNLIPRTRK